MFLGYVVFDTQVRTRARPWRASDWRLFFFPAAQMMIERAERGDSDYAWHALGLFIDLARVFTRVLIILTDNSGKKKRSRCR